MSQHKTQLNHYMQRLKLEVEVHSATTSTTPASLTSRVEISTSGKSNSKVGQDKMTGAACTNNRPRHVRKSGSAIPSKISQTSIQFRKKSSSNNNASSRRNRKTATMESLPVEILLKVFNFLPPADLLTCSCVCRQWMEIAGDDLLWQPLYNQFSLTQQNKKKETVSGMNPVYSSHAGVKWKSAFLTRCIEKRNARLRQVLKKVQPYSLLPANTDSLLKNLGVEWQLILTDSGKNDQVFRHSDVFHHLTSVTVRWYGLDLPAPDGIKHLSICAQAPVLFKPDGTPVHDSPTKMSLLCQHALDWSSKGLKSSPISQDSNITLYVIGQNILVASWKEGGGLAFVSASFHAFDLVQRCLLGSRKSCYHSAAIKPQPDDVDTQFGLHDYTCILELRNQRTVCWSEKFTHLHGSVKDIVDGKFILPLIRSFVETEHGQMSKKPIFPWKTDVFKGIMPDLLIVDLILYDEFHQPIWNFSRPVKLKPDENPESCLLYSGDYFSLEYMDSTGQVKTQIAVDDNEKQYIITSASVSVAVTAINEWFGTKY